MPGLPFASPQATIRSQAVLAVGNLSWSLHNVARSCPDSENTSHECDEGIASPVGAATPVARHRLRSLLESTLRLAAAESSGAAASAMRAVGYLALSLDSQASDTTAGASDVDARAEAPSPSEGSMGASVHLDTVPWAAPVAGEKITSLGGRGACPDVLSVAEQSPAENKSREAADDRSLQDRALLALSAGASGEDPGVSASTHGPSGLGAHSLGERRKDAVESVDHRADAAAAKCR